MDDTDWLTYSDPGEDNSSLETVTVNATKPTTNWNTLFWWAVAGYVTYRMAKDAKYV